MSPTFLEAYNFECTRNEVVPYTVKNPQSLWRSGFFIVNFEHIQPLALVFLLLNLKT